MLETEEYGKAQVRLKDDGFDKYAPVLDGKALRGQAMIYLKKANAGSRQRRPDLPSSC